MKNAVVSNVKYVRAEYSSEQLLEYRPLTPEQRKQLKALKRETGFLVGVASVLIALLIVMLLWHFLV